MNPFEKVIGLSLWDNFPKVLEWKFKNSLKPPPVDCNPHCNPSRSYSSWQEEKPPSFEVVPCKCYSTNAALSLKFFPSEKANPRKALTTIFYRFTNHHFFEYTTWKGSMAQLPLVLVYHGPLLCHLLGGETAIYFHHGVRIYHHLKGSWPFFLWWQRLPGPHPFFVNPGIREFLWHEWSTHCPTNRIRVFESNGAWWSQASPISRLISPHHNMWKGYLIFKQRLGFRHHKLPHHFLPPPKSARRLIFVQHPPEIFVQNPPVQCPPAPPCRRAFQRHHAYHSTNDPLRHKTWVVGSIPPPGVDRFQCGFWW